MEIYSFVFETAKGTSLHENISFDILSIKIGAGVLAVGWQNNQKIALSLRRIFSYLVGESGDCIVMKFCIVIVFHDIITHANLCDDRFRHF